MKILILSPHTDDVELAIGGSLARWADEGHDITVVAFSGADDSLLPGWEKGVTRQEFIKSMEMLGAGWRIDDFPVRRFSENRQAILDSMRQGTAYDLVVAPSLCDLHQDHKVIAEEARRAFKGRLLAYEPYNGSFNGSYYVGLNRWHMDWKMTLLDNYKSQKAKGRRYFDKEYIYGLAAVRGMAAGTEYAEAYEVVKWVE